MKQFFASTAARLLKRFGLGLYRIDKYTTTRVIGNSTVDLIALATDSVCWPDGGPVVVQIGACDGQNGDPIYKLITERHLSGVLVEPIPESASRLRTTYSRNENVKIVECAISNTNGHVTFYRVKSTKKYSDWSLQWCSLSRDHLIKHGVKSADIDAVETRAMTLKALLDECGVERCDFLQIDAEGFDDVIVDMALNLEHLPSIINFEYLHLPPDRLATILTRLNDAGFKWLQHDGDVLAIQQRRSLGQKQHLSCDHSNACGIHTAELTAR